MDENEFKSFNKILHIGKLYMSITQKIHGSNAQIHIFKTKDGSLDFRVGSRTRWLTPEEDNYGFAKFVHENATDIVGKLGEGRHFGEWAGKGINAGEGLEQKTFCLFNVRRWIGKELPNRVTTVPLLYKGQLSIEAINNAMEALKIEGSRLVPGYMKPEGIVIEIDGQLYKNVFDLEEVKWREKASLPGAVSNLDISHLLQPMRLEKLLSRDEQYKINYPTSLSLMCRDYVSDLEAEGQFKSTNEDDLKLEKKALGREIFFFVKSIMSAL